MATLTQLRTREVFHLHSHNLVGRARPCALLIDGLRVSNAHAIISWQNGAWHVRDLGSLNGTFLNGKPLEPTMSHPCAQGARIAFGDAEGEWELSDASEPIAMATPEGGGTACRIDRGIISIRVGDDTVASIHQGAEGPWLLETEDRVDEIVDGALIQLPAGVWRFSCPAGVTATESFERPPLLLEAVELHFRVSSDEEAVELDVRHQGRVTALGSRSAFYLLVTLARLRLAQQGTPGAGWVHWSELAKMLRAEQADINVWVHRIRERFAEAGFLRPGAVIERRNRTGQLRIGVDKLTITSM